MHPPSPSTATEAVEEVPTTLQKISWLKEGKAVLLSAYAHMAALAHAVIFFLSESMCFSFCLPPQ
jgi:hypothetical protein